METNYTYTLTPDDLYKFDWREEIKGRGYEVVRFGTFEPESNENFYLTPCGVIKNCSDWKGSVYPRLILREKKSRKWMIEEVEPEEATRIRSLYLVFNPQTNDFGAYSFVTSKENSEPDWIPVKVTEVTDAD